MYKKISAILFLFSPVLLIAQQATITGELFNTQNQVVEYANVILYNLPDTSYCCGTISENDGRFVINNVKIQEYIVKISLLGYNEKIFEINTANSTNLGHITLEPVTNELSEIIVTGNRPTFNYANNVLIMNVENTTISSLGDANDILKRMPGILYKENQYMVFGKGTPEIYIDNKKVRDLSELSLLNSDNIAQIELVNNPGSKYDAETLAVLVIRTKKKSEDRKFSVLFRERLQKGHRFGHSNNLSFNYQNKGISAFINLIDINTRKTTKEDVITGIVTDTTWSEHSLNNYKKNFNTYSLQSGIDYEFAKNHVIGVQYLYKQSPDDVWADVKTEVLANSIPFMKVFTKNEIQRKNIHHAVNLFYSSKLSDKLNLKADADYIKNTNNENQLSNEASDSNERIITTQSHSLFNIYAGKINLDYILQENNKINFGGEYSKVQGYGSFQNKENFIMENDYKNDEKKQALFLEYSFSDAFELVAGLRYEHVTSKSEDILGNNDMADKTYNHWLPSISFSIPVKNTLMGISYTNHIKKPSFSQLNNTLYYSSRFHYEMGNPQLQPQKIYDLACFTKWKSTTIQLNYQYIKDYIGFYTWADSENTYRTISSLRNYPNYQQLILQISTEFNINHWNSQLAMSFSKPWFKNEYLSKTVYLDKPFGYFSMNNIFKLPQDFTLYADLQYITKGTQEIYSVSASHETDIGIGKAFFKKSLTVSLWGIDIFNGQNIKVSKQTSTVSFWKQSFDDGRFVQLILTYRFNNVKKKYRGESSAKQEVERL